MHDNHKIKTSSQYLEICFEHILKTITMLKQTKNIKKNVKQINGCKINKCTQSFRYKSI